MSVLDRKARDNMRDFHMRGFTLSLSSDEIMALITELNRLEDGRHPYRKWDEHCFRCHRDYERDNTCCRALDELEACRAASASTQQEDGELGMSSP